MLEPRTMNALAEPLEEVTTLPELTVAQPETTAPHGVEKLHHSMGRGLAG
jgi:hypothetical protein